MKSKKFSFKLIIWNKRWFNYNFRKKNQLKIFISWKEEEIEIQSQFTQNGKIYNYSFFC